MSRNTLLSLLLAGFACASPVGAQEIAWHAGVGVSGELDAYEGVGPAEQFDLDDQSGTFVVGAEFGKGFGVEAAWLDVADGMWSLGATHAWHPGPFEPYVKAGWFSHDADDGAMAELGLRWKPAQAFALRLGYAWYGFDAGGDGSPQFLLEWHF
jgi:hypothetical protein